MTFEKLFDQYMKSPGFRNLSVRSKQLYIYCGKQLSDYFGNKDVDKIKRSTLLALQEERQTRPAHANLLIRVSSVVFAYAVNMDIIPFNPASRLSKLKVGSHIKWSPEEVKKVIEFGDRKISTAVALAWYTGQRESDVLNMRWCDYDGQYISMIQKKTGLEMAIKVHPDLGEYLNKIRGPDNEYIVSGQNRMSSSAFRGRLRRRTDKLHIDKVFHGIRKGVASALAENGRSVNEIAAILGHKTIRMAAYYAEQASNKTLTENAVDNLPSL